MRHPARSLVLLLAVLVGALGLAACGASGGDDASSASTTTSAADGSTTVPEGEGSAPSSTQDTTPSTPSVPPPTTGTTVAGGRVQELCAAAKEAVADLAPADASRASFQRVRDTWAALGEVLPPPHDETAKEIVAIYDEAFGSFGTDDANPSQAFVDAYTSGLLPLLRRSVALARYVRRTCRIVLPGFD